MSPAQSGSSITARQQLNGFQSGARHFGIPSADARTSLVFPVVGGRNITMALSVLALSMNGQRQAVGIVMGSCISAGISDA